MQCVVVRYPYKMQLDMHLNARPKRTVAKKIHPYFVWNAFRIQFIQLSRQRLKGKHKLWMDWVDSAIRLQFDGKCYLFDCFALVACCALPFSECIFGMFKDIHTRLPLGPRLPLYSLSLLALRWFPRWEMLYLEWICTASPVHTVPVCT